MKLILILIAILLYWIIGSLITALMITLGFFDNNEEDIILGIYSLCWPLFVFIPLFYLLWRLVKFISIKILAFFLLLL